MLLGHFGYIAIRGVPSGARGTFPSSALDYFRKNKWFFLHPLITRQARQLEKEMRDMCSQRAQEWFTEALAIYIISIKTAECVHWNQSCSWSSTRMIEKSWLLCLENHVYPILHYYSHFSFYLKKGFLQYVEFSSINNNIILGNVRKKLSNSTH